MNKNTQCIILAILFSLSSGLLLADNENLQQQWTTDGFHNPESAVYDNVNKVLYVSNVNGAPSNKDGNGYISKVSLDGMVMKADWVTGMNAPKGLAIHNGKLYAADIDTLIEIDIAGAKIINSYKIDDAKFFNDVAASNDGEIFVSDTGMNRIYHLKNGRFTTWIETPDLQSPNGLLVEADRLLVGQWGATTGDPATTKPGHIMTISLKDKSVSSIGDGTPIGNLDGIEPDPDGDYYVTDWLAGKLFHIGGDGKIEILLTLVQGMADLEYIASEDLIILPMMNTNQLIAYKAHLKR